MSHTTRIAGYDVLAVLGYGANSTIYAVQDKKSSQVYALKRVVKSGPSDQKFIDQAVNEYNISNKIDHPIVRKCFKLKKHRKMMQVVELYLLMELVDGRSLVQERPATMVRLIEILSEVAEGLGEMHKAGFVHADMKPNNILITEDQKVKVIDFGQSCPLGTVKDRIQGTPDYIAPEQVKRRSLTAQTDIFNLGATMYWCLTDTHIPTLIPRNKNEIGLREDMKLKPPNEFNETIPLALNNLVLQCLAKRPSERPHSMTEVIARFDVAAKKLNGDEPAFLGRNSKK